MSEEYSLRDTKLNIIIGMSVWVIVPPEGYIYLNALCSEYMAGKINSGRPRFAFLPL